MAQKQAQSVQPHLSPTQIIERMLQAANQHDLEAMVAYFAPDYRSEQPLHPERAFIGQAGVRKNWSYFFATIPNMRIEIVNQIADDETVWAELHYHGMQTDGSTFNYKGMCLWSVRANQIIWGRVYSESVQERD